VASHAGFWQAYAHHPPRALSPSEAVAALGTTPHILLNAPLLAARAGLAEVSGLDLLELFAFVHPARFAVPSVAGLASALGLPAPGAGGAEATFLLDAAARMLDTVAEPGWPERAGAPQALARLGRRGWPWAGCVGERLAPADAMVPDLFEALAPFEEQPPRGAARTVPFGPDEAEAMLERLAGDRREPRAAQRAYAQAILHAFQPTASDAGPNLVVAEAGTGTGKTLGYLAPAALYVERTGGQIWLSTYTRALQRQLRAEIGRSLPALAARGEVVVRKGRENYLCLLNLEDALQGGFSGRAAHFAELVARWVRFSADGDMVGGDLPGWLPGLFRHGSALPALTDRRGECVHGGCPHYRRCFIEKNVRAAAAASLVVANHALVMANAAGGRAEGQAIDRVLFDEGHHLHAAADSAFALALTGGEAIELRRWLLGPERPGRARGRRRGLAARLIDVASYDQEGAALVERVIEAARALPADQWLDRLRQEQPQGPIEALLAAVRTQILTRAEDEDLGFTLETDVAALMPAVVDAVGEAAAALAALGRAIRALAVRLAALAGEAPPWLDAGGMQRIGATHAGLGARADLLDAWGRLLARLGGEAEPAFVDWFALSRHEGRELDCGIHRHWLDPLEPFAGAVLGRLKGAAVTSATLGRPIEAAAGASHLDVAPHRFEAPGPFDYARAAHVLIVTDVRPRDVAALSLAYARLIEASGGGALGLFTAIARLRAVHARIHDRLARAGLPLFAQHVDPVDTGTLVDLFRADRAATLLGTDGLRDGVDVPGDSLRLILFEGVPWSRPTILGAARRAALGGSQYEDAQVRHRLAQAFGRLIRTAADRGVFVLMGSAVPSRLLDAFPPGVPISRVPLEEAIAEVRRMVGHAGMAGIAPAAIRP